MIYVLFRIRRFGSGKIFRNLILNTLHHYDFIIKIEVH